MIVWIICFVVVVGFAIWAISVNAQKVQGELDAVYEKMGHQIIKLTHVHASALARKREQGMYRDDYGVIPPFLTTASSRVLMIAV